MKSSREIANYYDGIDGHYDALYSSPVCLAEDEVVMKLVAPHLLPNASVLDIGCGTGLIASHINGQNFKGIDVSSTELSTAIEKMPQHREDFYVADMHDIPFPSKAFDVVTSTYGPFSYSQEPEELIKEIMRPLKDSGIFLVMPYSKRTGMSIGLGGSTAAVDGHVSRIYYTQKRIEAVFSSIEEKKIVGINYLANLVMEEVEESRQELEIDEHFLCNELTYLVNRMGEENFCLPEKIDFGSLPRLWREFLRDRNNVNLMSEILLEEIRIFDGMLPAHFARHMAVVGRKNEE